MIKKGEREIEESRWKKSPCMFQRKREYSVHSINCMSVKGIKMGKISVWKQNLPKGQKEALRE